MKTRLVLTACLLVLAVNCFSQQRVTRESLDSLRASFFVDADEMVSGFEAYAQEAEQAYQRDAARLEEEYRRFAHQVSRVWGTDSLGQIVEDTKHEWVEYGKHYKSRSRVNFETGRVVVEVALDPKEAKDSLKQTQRLAEAVQQLLESRGSSSPFDPKQGHGEALTAQPILQGLLDLSPYQGLDVSLVDESDSTELALTNSRPAPPQPTVRGGELVLQSRDDASRREQDASLAPGDEQPTGSTSRDNGVSRGSMASRRSQQLRSREAARSEAARRASERAAARHHAAKATPKEGPSPSSAAGNGKDSGKTLASRIIAEQSVKQLSQVKGSNGEVRQVVAIEMKLVADNLSKNAALYKDLVAEFSNRYQVEQPLIFAVIEQESAFNPQATSWVPAYGLMQLVPTSGGRHAYRYVYGKEWCPTQAYLYNPRNNIELGTAYLRVLLNQFAAVGNIDCRRLCAIASYNTGAGNVSRSFTGGTSVVQATPLINKMDYATLYNHLTTRLSHSEARGYVAGVTRRMTKYVKQE